MKDLIIEKYVKLMSFLKKEEGQTLVEYALLLVLIAIVVIAAVKIVGQEACNVFSQVGDTLKNP